MKNPKFIFSFLALISGIVAITLAVFSENGGFTYDSKSTTFTEKSIEYFNEKILKKDVDSAKNRREFAVQDSRVLICGIIAVVLGIGTAFIKAKKKSKSEKKSYFYFDASLAALTLGSVALLWNYIIMALVIGIVFYIFYGLISGSIDMGF